jgi:hypothetical protein
MRRTVGTVPARAQRRLPLLACLLATLCWGAGARSADCSCPEARRVDGWCEAHATGYIAGLPVASQLVHEALDAHGHEVDPATFDCPRCRAAIAASGFCDEHSVGFVRSMAYFSRLTYEIARGTRSEPQRLECKVCRKNSESLGWCDRCKAGTIGNVVIRDQEAYARAASALRMVQDALVVAKRCERCAVAMVTSSQCPLCRISYKDGKKVGG